MFGIGPATVDLNDDFGERAAGAVVFGFVVVGVVVFSVGGCTRPHRDGRRFVSTQQRVGGQDQDCTACGGIIPRWQLTPTPGRVRG